VDVDVQNTSGHQFYQALFRILIVYDNMTNIIVRVNPTSPKYNNEAILLSSHFDSAHTSPGCHDDGLPTSVMLEILRNVIAATNDGTLTLHHPIIFLFNGAEEIFMCAAHGFVKQHPWVSRYVHFLTILTCLVSKRLLTWNQQEVVLNLFYSRHLTHGSQKNMQRWLRIL
jgi:hypothetical protein